VPETLLGPGAAIAVAIATGTLLRSSLWRIDAKPIPDVAGNCRKKSPAAFATGLDCYLNLERQKPPQGQDDLEFKRVG
jgi:hypothetical protein